MFLTMCHASCLFNAHSSANSTGSRWCTGGNIVLKGCSMMSTKECSKFWRKLHHLWHSWFKKPNFRKSGVLARTVVPRSCKCHWSSAKVYRLSNAWSQLNMVRILSRQSQGGSLMYRNYSMYQFISPLRWLVTLSGDHDLSCLGWVANLGDIWKLVTPECRSVPLESDVDPQRSEGGHPMFDRLRHGQDHEDIWGYELSDLSLL